MNEAITICSISPDDYLIRRAYLNQIYIPARPATASFSSIRIEGAKDAKVFWQSLSEKEVVPFYVPAQDIVNDIFQSEQLEAKGVFALPKGRTEPTEKELATARKKRRDQLVAWATDGDRLYSQFGDRGIQHIPDVSKRAVLELGQSRKWVFAPDVETKECDVCGDTLKPLANGNFPILCKGCGAILDQMAYDKKNFAAEPETKRKPGRPKKEVTETVTA